MPEPKYFVNDFKDVIARRFVNKERVLFVEGSDELWFFDHLLDELGAQNDSVQIIDYGGTGNFEENLTILLKQDMFLDDEIKALGIIQDADRSRTKRQYDFSGKFAKIMNAPEMKVGKMSKVARSGKLHVGAFLLPNSQDDGNLDTLMLNTVANDEAVIDAGIYLKKHDKSKAEDQDKRTVQIYLATRKTLSRGPGFGARQGYFNLAEDAMDDLRSFLTDFITA